MDINTILNNPYTITFIAGLAVALVAYFLFGIGKSQKVHPSTTNKDSSSILNTGNISGDVIGRDKITNNYNSEKDKKERRIQSISLKDIADKISEASPYDKKAAKEKYLGFYVSWKVQLYSLKDNIYKSDGSTHITMTDVNLGLPHVPIVTADINLSNYPELKHITKSDTFIIQGEINEADELYVTLKNVELKF